METLTSLWLNCTKVDTANISTAKQRCNALVDALRAVKRKVCGVASPMKLLHFWFQFLVRAAAAW